MSTESETKSAGVPAGATHVCTKCGQYWFRRGVAVLPLGPVVDWDCPCGDLRPIAEAGPAPTTAAPAELPNRREFHVSTPAEFAAAANVAQGGDTIIVPEWPLPRATAPAEQLSEKVVCKRQTTPHPMGDHNADTVPLPCENPRPAEQPGKALHDETATEDEPWPGGQPGKAADPRKHPTVRCACGRFELEIPTAQPAWVTEGAGSAAVRHAHDACGPYGSGFIVPQAADPRPAQPQAPAEPTQEQFAKVAQWWTNHGPARSTEELLIDYAEHVAAPLREERDRLAERVVDLEKQLAEKEEARLMERRRLMESAKLLQADADAAEAKVAERDARLEKLCGRLTEIADDCECGMAHPPGKLQRKALELAAKKIRAALGASEGQPPAALSAPPPPRREQELLGKEGAKPDRPDLRTLIAQLLGVVELAECEDCDTMHGEAGGCVGCAGAHSAVVDAREAMKDPPASAPPRKAPQEDAAAKLASVREYVAYMFNPASLDELHMRGTFAAGVWKRIRPSSPEEQLSGKELK